METLYFIGFCIGIAGIIFWGLRHDDQADFQGQRRDGKFRPSKATDSDAEMKAK